MGSPPGDAAITRADFHGGVNRSASRADGYMGGIGICHTPDIGECRSLDQNLERYGDTISAGLVAHDPFSRHGRPTTKLALICFPDQSQFVSVGLTGFEPAAP
ncbi:hypothetical protein [Nocardioides luteus]|uniref:hypothetical protein n=1 Tax=Nocardioides luteus TaxID=1844 RepID=UPI00166AC408|nr:hypothetical protein [Nocardioides luteus]